MSSDDDHVYLSLAEGHADDARWAFGTGFEDPLHGVDTTLPPGVDAGALTALCLALADDALVAAQRLAQWITLAPELEEEVALANIGLDLLGQARLLYARAGQAEGAGRDEDALAYFRDQADFRNVVLAELPNGDFAHCVVKLLLLSSWRLAELTGLTEHPDPVLAAVARKGVSELTYHRDHAAQWVVRLGDGTEESARRTSAALAELWPYRAELYAAAPQTRDEVEAVLAQVLDAAHLSAPTDAPTATASGRSGEHTEHLAELLAELQSVARADPEATW
ncbi:1,2-phenylacetyl-CoA epoxidase subunit PaaC [Streptacidiphilus jiangxiensis]|uniref:Ring-1,2-phenylacetyl-CoA epoxidase subunit PaaC n=1 Tax=Streptacidiphilus jiangxiensis TaxID=235985 RepID=A0A1H7Y7D9_STRJI|nr:1,2-phenylacetyl-CoA epoxidase subunit PaaC [Streptacidiphilus jiangxiensis]SEM42082.1 ring-1,2-phenylacetyl-CoA epoxidase subunit PaaC [Streptacidiphilus jiangxiensis]